MYLKCAQRVKIKINKSFVDKAEVPAGKDQISYRDSELRGFALRVTANGVKSFVVEKKLDIGKQSKIALSKKMESARFVLVNVPSISNIINLFIIKALPKLLGITNE